MNSAIKGIMDNFDFEKVYKVMTYLKWCWRGREVTRSMIIAHALTDLLEVEADPNPTAYKASGGFVASKEGTCYSLSFQLEEWDEDLDELEQLMEQDNLSPEQESYLDKTRFEMNYDKEQENALML